MHCRHRRWTTCSWCQKCFLFHQRACLGEPSWSLISASSARAHSLFSGQHPETPGALTPSIKFLDPQATPLEHLLDVGWTKHSLLHRTPQDTHKEATQDKPGNFPVSGCENQAPSSIPEGGSFRTAIGTLYKGLFHLYSVAPQGLKKVTRLLSST